MNLRAQNFYEPATPKKIKHKTPKKKEPRSGPKISEFKEILWTQHQIFNEPKAPNLYEHKTQKIWI